MVLCFTRAYNPIRCTPRSSQALPTHLLKYTGPNGVPALIPDMPTGWRKNGSVGMLGKGFEHFNFFRRKMGVLAFERAFLGPFDHDDVMIDEDVLLEDAQQLTRAHFVIWTPSQIFGETCHNISLTRSRRACSTAA